MSLRSRKWRAEQEGDRLEGRSRGSTRAPWGEGMRLASVPQPTPALFLSHFEVYKYLFFFVKTKII